MSGSVSFDRAAEYYDATRGRTPAGASAEARVLADALAGRGRALEVGVGTGQIALPLHAAGVDVVGVDLARPMLDVLRRKVGGAAPFPLVLGDATRLPFRHGAFGAAYVRWLFHLIPAWPTSVDEVVRVLAPGAVFLVQLGDYGEGPTELIRAHFCALVGIDGTPAGLDWGDYPALTEMMARHGATLRELPSFTDAATWTVEDFMAGIEGNRFSWTWSVPDDDRVMAAAATRAWAEAEMGALADVPRDDYVVTWRAYDLP